MKTLRLLSLIAVFSLGANAADKKPADFASLPAAAQASISAALGADEAAYFATGGHAIFRAQNKGQKLDFTFASSGIEAQSGDAHWGITLTAFGRGHDLKPVAVARPQAIKNRVEYGRKNLTEWYVNGPEGLEQGFTIAQRPQGNDALTLAVQFSGELTATADEDGTGLTLSREGDAKLRYTGLRAYDADGKDLQVSLELHARKLLLKVEDTNAHYPVVVDPVVQVAKLTASNGGTGSFLGLSIAMSNDVIVVGGYQAYGAYVFVKPGNGWHDMTQQAVLRPSTSADNFGVSVAISGNIILVGASGTSATDQGKVYVYVKPSQGWHNAFETAQLVPSDGAADDQFGASVSVSGNVAVVGAPQATVNGNSLQGAAYIYTQPAQDWSGLIGITLTETAKLTASDGNSGSFFGSGISISNNTIAVGALLGNSGTGEAYVFLKPEGGWVDMTETAQLKPSDSGGALGDSVATNGGTVVADAPIAGTNVRPKMMGTAYVFVEPVDGWTDMTETAQLLPSTTPGSFGNTIAIDSTGHAIAVSSPSGAGSKGGTGQVYVYLEPVNGWQTTAKPNFRLYANDGQPGDQFGYSVAINGKMVATGAPLAKIGNNLHQGAAYVFAKQ